MRLSNSTCELRWNKNGIALDIKGFTYLVNLHYRLIGAYSTKANGIVSTYIWKYF